jgi:hypothetical protein
MIANLIVFAGLFASILALTDLLLADAQKKRIEMLTIRAWARLDDLKRMSLVDAFKNSKAFTVSATLLMALLIYGALAIYDPDFRPSMSWFEDSIWGLLASIVVGGLILGLIAWDAATDVIYELRPTTSLRTFLLVPLAMIVVIMVLGLLIGLDERETYTDHVLFTCIIFGCIVSLIARIVTAIPLIIVGLLTALLWPVEFLVRRIAESSKGLVVAVGLLVTLGGAILKMFG